MNKDVSPINSPAVPAPYGRARPSPIGVAQKRIREASKAFKGPLPKGVSPIRSPKALLDSPLIVQLASKSWQAEAAYLELEAKSRPSLLNTLIEKLSQYLPSLKWLVINPEDIRREFLSADLFVEAVNKDCHEAAAFLIQEGFDLSQLSSSQKEKAALRAAQKGSEGLLTALIKREPTLKTAPVLQAAIAHGQTELAAHLLSEDFPIDLATARVAISKASPDLLLSLLKRVPSDVAPELAAVVIRQGDLERLKLLKEAGIDLRAPNAEGETPLHIAVRYNNLDIIALLIDDLNTQDARGRTPLMVAAEHGQVTALKCLLKLGADTQVKDKEGQVLLERVQADRNKTVRAFLYHNQQIWRPRTPIPFFVRLNEWESLA